MLDTYCLLQLLHTSCLLDFGAPNPGRRHIECNRRLGGGRPGGLPFALGEQHLRPLCGGMDKDWLSQPMCLPGVITAGMDGC